MKNGLGLDGAYNATLDRIKGQGRGKIGTRHGCIDVDFSLRTSDAHLRTMPRPSSRDWLLRYRMR